MIFNIEKILIWFLHCAAHPFEQYSTLLRSDIGFKMDEIIFCTSYTQAVSRPKSSEITQYDNTFRDTLTLAYITAG